MRDTAVDALAMTARWTAAVRASEHERPDRLFADPLAAVLAGTDGEVLRRRMDPAGAGLAITVRTRFVDDALRAATGDGQVRQVVLVGAGMDTRAFRLPWPDGTILYELDRPELLAEKERLLTGATVTEDHPPVNDRLAPGIRTTGGRRVAPRSSESCLESSIRHSPVTPTCTRRTVGADVTAAWTAPLLAAGFQPHRPSVWVLEGLLVYLEPAAVEALMEQVGTLAGGGSHLVLDAVNEAYLHSPMTRDWLARLAADGTPWRFGTDEPQALLERQGWHASVTDLVPAATRLGRWHRPQPPPGLRGLPRLWLVRGGRGT